MIPRILSQTWKTSELPGPLAAYRDSWVRHNPGMECRIHDDAAARDIVHDVIPGKIDAYDRLPFPVMKADIYRYAVVWRDGGYYADLDMECLKGLPEALFEPGCLLAVEAIVTERRRQELGYARPYQIANCIFGAVPRHPFLRAALDRAFALLSERDSVAVADIEDITGPRMLTRLFYETAYPDLRVARPIVLMAPLHYPAAWPINRAMHARHWTMGSWKDRAGSQPLSRRWNERNRLVNPFVTTLTRSQSEFLQDEAADGTH